MKKFLFFVIIISIAGYFGWQQKQMVYSVLGLKTLPIPAEELKNPIEKINYRVFNQNNKTLESYLDSGSHSIIIVTSENCSKCKETESSIDKILELRKDVSVKKVLMEKPAFNPNSVEQIKFQKRLLDKFGLTTLPIVKVYNDKKEAIALDTITGDDGESFIEFWKNAELEAQQN